MGKRTKKGQSGAAVNYIPRNRALKKLQLSLADFRRLCILKGVYPVEPRHKKKVNHGSTAHRTYYFAKDILFLSHEPLLEKFREFKVFVKKLKRAIHKGEIHSADKLVENKPVYTLDHVIKERYPSFVDALRELDDALPIIFLFAHLPQQGQFNARVAQQCRRLSVEFLHYVIEARALRKVFLSVKGIYYQIEIHGETVTWVTPYQFCHEVPSDVDLRVMLTFLEVYAALLGFINYQLYNSINLRYPPLIPGVMMSPVPAPLLGKPGGSYDPTADEGEGLLACLGHSLAKMVHMEEGEGLEEEAELPLELTDEEEEKQRQVEQEETEMKEFKQLFSQLKFFLSREVPREALVFIIRSFGGCVSWDSCDAPGASYNEDDDGITHQVVDRPLQRHVVLSRDYIQPQWVFDSINQRSLLPVGDYAPGVALPPHLSPFVEEKVGDYVPPEREQLVKLAEPVEEDDINPDDDVTEEPPSMDKEEKKLAASMLPRKRRQLYERIVRAQKKKASEVRKLKRKRATFDEAKEKLKRQKLLLQP
ncbi:pescadillo homolog [Dysidea avara]|uniref:pescadillo homolog n=1 Tax=Dysidea avara TaxID=196820 RepID=UPI003319ABB1